MVRVEAVHKFFGRVWAVRGVSFELAPGQIAGLLGPNGAGKTTTIRMIAGFLLPDSGRVVIDGQDTVDDPAGARRNLGYLPESTPLYPEMRVQDYLHYRGRLFGLWRRERVQAVDDVIDRCWLRDMRRRRIGRLSKGYRQRVGLAAAMLHKPKVLILDEPTNGLDPGQIGETRRLVRELSAERTMLVSSHILPEVERLCDRVIVIAGGRVRADGGVTELAEREAAAPRYVVEARCGSEEPREQLVRLLQAVPGAERVQREALDRAAEQAGWARYVVWSRAESGDLREAIAASAQQAGAAVRELHREAASLEQAFARIVEGDDERLAVQGGGARAIRERVSERAGERLGERAEDPLADLPRARRAGPEGPGGLGGGGAGDGGGTGVGA